MLVGNGELEPERTRLQPSVARQVEADGLGCIREPVTSLCSPTHLSRLLNVLGTWSSSAKIKSRHQCVCDVGRDVLFHFTLISTNSYPPRRESPVFRSRLRALWSPVPLGRGAPMTGAPMTGGVPGALPVGGVPDALPVVCCVRASSSSSFCLFLNSSFSCSFRSAGVIAAAEADDPATAKSCARAAAICCALS